MSDLDDRDQDGDYSDEEEEEEEEDVEEWRKKERFRLFKAAKDEIRSREGKFATPEALDEFLKVHGNIVRQPDENYGTLLHGIVDLVEDGAIKSKIIRPLVERLVKDYSDLLRTPNDQDQNPLYRAIWRRKWVLVEDMLLNCADNEARIEALERPCKRESNKTCLHMAFEKNIRPLTLKKLIQYASNKALGAKDSSGKTPLHYAVKYGQCKDERVAIIQQFMDRDLEAIQQQRRAEPSKPVDTFLDCVDNFDKSVYREHLASAAEDLRKMNAKDAETAAAKRQRETETMESDKPQPDGGSQLRSDPKAAIRQKDTKHQTGRDRERVRGRVEDREREKAEPESLDERQLWRQRLREQEMKDRERHQSKKKTDRDQAPDNKKGPHRELALDTKVVPDITGESSPLVSTAEPAPNTSLKRTRTIVLAVSKEKEKGKSSETKKPKGVDKKMLEKNSEEILRRLKLHYMRTRNTEMATAFLYGKNPEDVQICFDYLGLPLEVKDHVFLKTFGADKNVGIRFDEVLQSVRFTSVTVQRSGRNAGKGQLGGLGRRDMEFFFKWLLDKGVRHILKLVVDDTSKTVHSDEAIQRSLENIMIEHLDWQKVDLDPQVLCRVGSLVKHKSDAVKGSDESKVRNRLKELTLRWSGNNAILRAWGECEGLALLPELSTIHLHIPTTLNTSDSPDYLQQKVEEFEVRLNKNAQALGSNETTPVQPKASIDPEDPSEGDVGNIPSLRRIDVFQIHDQTGKEQRVASNDTTQPSNNANKTITSHEWLKCMDKLASNFAPFWTETHKRFLNRLGEGQPEGALETVSGVEKDVVVALIDDGVTSCDPDFAGRILEGKTFDYHDGAVGQYYVSERGHGTEMAKMILRVCPMAKIYPIRLKTLPSPDGTLQFDLRSAALAIDAALEKNATIISMSWTIPVPEQDSEGNQLMRRVLNKACKRKVLMFCSSPDSGQFSDQDYPTAFKRDSFFRIGAANDDGSAYSYAGQVQNLDFIFPGVNVQISPDGSYGVRQAANSGVSKEATGSSIATALAAGLAAIVIFCFKASALVVLTDIAKEGSDYKPGPGIVIKPEQVKKVSEHNVLKVAFKNIGEVTEGHFIQAWDSFGTVNKVFEDLNTTYEKQVECIMNLCSNLVKHELRISSS